MCTQLQITHTYDKTVVNVNAVMEVAGCFFFKEQKCLDRKKTLGREEEELTTAAFVHDAFLLEVIN